MDLTKDSMMQQAWKEKQVRFAAKSLSHPCFVGSMLLIVFDGLIDVFMSIMGRVRISATLL